MMVIALLSLLLLVTSGTGQECAPCAQDYCRNVTADQSDGCYNAVLPQSNSCNCNSSVLECNGANANILPEFVDCEMEGFNMSLSETSTLDPIGSGFYFIRGYQFCMSKCFNKIFLLAEFNQTLAGSRDVLRFHIYKRYTNAADFPSSFFVEQYNFSVMLTPVKESNYTVEATVTDPMACFDSNDYLGFSVGEGLTIETSGITGRGLRQGLQIYDHIPLISNCSSNSTILNLPFGNRVQSSLPVMALSYKERTSSTTDSERTSTEITSERTTSITDDSETKPTEMKISTSAGTSTQSSSSSTPLIVGVVVAVILVIGVLMTITIVSFQYFRYLQNSRKVYLGKKPAISGMEILPGGSMVSMNSVSVNYHDNDMVHDMHNKVTVINPHADIDDDLMNHHYHVPYEMNDGANARSTGWHANTYKNSQVQPASMMESSRDAVVINSQYGVPSELFRTNQQDAGPTYQSPHELVGTPKGLNRRGTIPNALYSTTEEFGVKTTFGPPSHHNSMEQLSPIYNEPFELEAPPSVPQQPQIDSPIARPHVVPAVRIGLYGSDIDSDSLLSGSRNSLECAPGNMALEYSLPFPTNAEKPPPTIAVSPLTIAHGGSQSSQTHMLGNITGDDINHHYHLLDDEASQGGYTTDEEDDFTASRIHHVVNQPGAYVPNSEERRELYSGDTLKPASLEAWKKSSFKKGKFFVRHEKFWVPSQNKTTLFDQLSQKKFREIFKDHLEIKTHIGSGMFGSVQKAMLKYPSGGGGVDVAVKVMRPSVLENAQVKFLQEAAIMGQFFHPNIIELFGIVTLNKPLMIVMEYMPLGDLHTYLHKQYRSTGAAPPQPVTLLKFCRQVVHGMTYLAGKHFVHRDLAARNVFVSSTLVCKIGDFGMSRNLMDEEYYKSQGGVVPIKWTAPEGLLFKKYSSASDVYSYGMTMFEIWSLGEKPLRDIPIQHVAKTISDGYCQPPPPGTPKGIYQVMVQCWNPHQNKRVTFEEISEVLSGDDESLLSWSEMDEDENSDSKVIGSPLENGYSLYKDLQNTYNPASSEVKNSF